MAEQGSDVCEPPGETHRLVVDPGVPEMVTLFNVSGALLYCDENGGVTHAEDVFDKLAMAKAHYERVGLGAGYIIIDILLPLLLFMLFAYKYVFPTLGIAVGAVELAAVEGATVVKDAEGAVNAVADDVEEVARLAMKRVEAHFANSVSDQRDWPGSYI